MRRLRRSLSVTLGLGLLLALVGSIYLAQPTEAQRDWIHVQKLADPADGTAFGFVNTDGPYGPFTWSLRSGEVRGFAGEGPYTITESVPVGWRLDRIECQASEVTWAVQGETVTATKLSEESFIDCTFYNEQVGRIIVQKVTSPAGAPAAVFGFVASFGGFSLAGGGSHDSGPLPAGSYSVAEVCPLPAGWSLSSAVCSDGSSPTGIGLAPGETVTCVFTNRWPTCFGRAATIIGTPGPDTLVGTAGPDVIVGLGGGDIIEGLGGNDRICGGAGPDQIWGGAGKDRIRGNRGADIIYGGLGDDRLRGGLGVDWADGGPGVDNCSAETTVACP